MSGINEAVIANLEQDLAKYEKVYLVGEGFDLSLLLREKGHNMFYFPSDIYAEDDVKTLGVYRVLSEDEVKEIRQLYGMYEFADNFRVLEGSCKNYGCLMNYVRTGVLSEDEAYSAMLE